MCHYVTTFQLRKLWIRSSHKRSDGGHPCHLATSLYIVGFLLAGVDNEHCLRTTITQALARLVPAATVIAAMLRYGLLNLNTDVMCAGPLMVLSLNICELFS